MVYTNMHRLTWGPYAHGASVQLSSVSMGKNSTEPTDTCLLHLYIYIYMVQCYAVNLVLLCAYT
jgi:hypothetical protein